MNSGLSGYWHGLITYNCNFSSDLGFMSTFAVNHRVSNVNLREKKKKKPTLTDIPAQVEIKDHSSVRSQRTQGLFSQDLYVQGLKITDVSQKTFHSGHSSAEAILEFSLRCTVPVIPVCTVLALFGSGRDPRSRSSSYGQGVPDRPNSLHSNKGETTRVAFVEIAVWPRGAAPVLD